MRIMGIVVKIVCSILMVGVFSLGVEARDIYDKELPSSFKRECFEFFTSKEFGVTQSGEYIVNVNKGNAIAVRGEYLTPLIPYTQVGEKLLFTTDLGENVDFLIDDNIDTFLELDTDVTKTIQINFLEALPKGGFEMSFRHTADTYIPEVFISEDGTRFSPVSFSNIADFSVKSMKITYRPRDFLSCEEAGANCKREVIKVKELQFFKTQKTHLIKVKGGGKVDFYSDYHCDDSINLQTITVPFAVTENTLNEEVILEKNPYYNPNIEKDSDADGIDNFSDNCPNVFNPLQKDSDDDNVGDSCSDYDNDEIVGYKDNCPDVANPDQTDMNNNNVGDVCEFDKDSDGIFDSIDNCISIINPLQRDSDRDGIGDSCDNCKLFNPQQKDVNENLIGDVCDAKNEILSKNDDDVDGIINGTDNCPNIKNPDQKDEDQDGVGDTCDNCKALKNTNQLDFDKNSIGDICEDSDKDGVDGINDNCINTSNSNQKDTDNDGVGDLCEDDDRDGILFKIDNCPFDYNPFQKDTDNDNIGDVCDETDDNTMSTNKDIWKWGLIIFTFMLILGIFVMGRKIAEKPSEEKKK